jgi:hypothetical protein
VTNIEFGPSKLCGKRNPSTSQLASLSYLLTLSVGCGLPRRQTRAVFISTPPNIIPVRRIGWSVGRATESDRAILADYRSIVLFGTCDVCEPRAAVNRRTASQSPLVRRPLLPTLKEQGRRTLRGLLSDPLGLAAQNPGARDQNNPFPFQPLNRVTDTRHVAPPWSSRRENDEVTQAPTMLQQRVQWRVIPIKELLPLTVLWCSFLVGVDNLCPVWGANFTVLP